MPQVQLLLIPTPGAKPEFLATVTTSETSATLCPPKDIILEGYTRDAWAWKPHSSWTTVEITPADDKSQQKLNGFLKYLKERQKCAYGRFSTTPTTTTTTAGVVVLSYIQSSTPVVLRFTHDATQLPNCSIIKQQQQQRNSPSEEQQKVPPKQKVHPQQPTTVTTTTSKKVGMLGNLLGAQKRTDQHMNVTVAKKPPREATSDDSASLQKTAQQVLQDFRRATEQKMLDFDLEKDENCCKVRLELAKITRGLRDEEKARVTIQVLKYIVYEQAEEVNEEWVACKEPSEFVDDIVICVYKEAPPEVLEQVNQVEVTDEVRGVGRAISEARRKVAAREEYKLQHCAVQADDDDLATLNTNKRDRRTIEEIQLGLNDHHSKRARSD